MLGLAAFALMLVLAPGASARSTDRNHDRIPDRWERVHHLSLKVNQAAKDQDRDGMRNRAEYRAGTDPRDADTDDDGVNDGREDSGSVVSFTGGVLTIKLYRNDKTVEGKVDDATELKCKSATAASPRDSGRDDEGDDDHGDREHGDDDQGDDNDDQGDDDHGAAICGTDKLTPGTVVHEAELSTTPDGLHFDEIKLGDDLPALPSRPPDRRATRRSDRARWPAGAAAGRCRPQVIGALNQSDGLELAVEHLRLPAGPLRVEAEHQRRGERPRLRGDVAHLADPHAGLLVDLARDGLLQALPRLDEPGQRAIAALRPGRLAAEQHARRRR